MNVLRLRTLIGKKLGISLLACLICPCLSGICRFTSNDPYPVYSAGNPYADFTYFSDCEAEQHARFAFSVFRQSADKGRSDAWTTSSVDSCDAQATETNTCCQSGCCRDIELGDIHGPWAALALFYPEENDDTTTQARLASALGLDLSDPSQACTKLITEPAYSDSGKQFGFYSVPIEYRKHGIRLEADINTCWDIGIRLQTGVATIRQQAKFNDLTCSAEGENCKVLDSSCTETCCLVEEFPCACKQTVMRDIMTRLDTIADVLGVSVQNFCQTGMEDLVIGLYWKQCFDNNASKAADKDEWARYTMTPFLRAEVSAPMSKQEINTQLLSLPFGNNNHWAYGGTIGFVINFIETIEIGFDFSVTGYSSECYVDYPVPTDNLQTGLWPRLATMKIDPGKTWSFGGTLGAYHFIDRLSAYIEFRDIRHCQDSFTPLTIKTYTKLPDGSDLQTPDTSTITNIKVHHLEEYSNWSSSFVNTYIDYDISPNCALGFFWQAPVRQRFAYRPTTVMGSILFKF